MHGTARLAEMLNKYSEELQFDKVADFKENFLIDEIKLLEEAKSIGLPNFIIKSPFHALLQKKVNAMSAKPADFVEKFWSYVENLVVSVLLKHSAENYPQLVSCTRRAAQNLISKKKQESIDWVKDMVDMGNLTDYTCNPGYLDSWNRLMSRQDEFTKNFNDPEPKPIFSMDGFGDIDVGHLVSFKGVVKEVFDVKMRMDAYWDIVLKRMVDYMALHLLFGIQNLVNKEMQTDIINELVGPRGNGLERMLEEPPSIAEKRNKLKKSIKLLKESKDVVANIMDRVSTSFH